MWFIKAMEKACSGIYIHPLEDEGEIASEQQKMAFCLALPLSKWVPLHLLC